MRFSVTRYVLAIGFFVAVVVFGIVSAANLGVDLLPSVNIPVVVVSTSFPGAAPAVVDAQVSQVIEDAVSTLSGITDLSSSSSEGRSRVSIGFGPGSDRNAAANQVATVVSAVARRLPAGATPPTVSTFDPNSMPILQFGILSTGVPLESVGSWVENDLIPQLQRIDGVANVMVDGAPTRQFQVLLDPNRLVFYGLNPTHVTAAIAGSAVNQAIGSVTHDRQSMTFATRNQPENARHVASILIDPVRGINVGKVAVVRDVPVAATVARLNGQPAVLVSIQQTSDSNAVGVVRSVRALLAAAPLPEGYSIVVSNDTTVPIRSSIDSTYRELVLTALVVAIICLLFLGKLNTAISVILAIPIALSAAPVLYQLAGFNFNLVSLLALVVAIGIVVDDSIVVAENVERYRRMGYSLKESALKGASEVFSAVVAASLSLLAVLVPVSFIGGFVGRYLMQFSLGLAAAVFFSLLEAILFLTVRLAYTPDARTFEWRDVAESVVRLPHALRWGFAALRKPAGIVVACVVAGALLYFGEYWWLLALPAYPIALSIMFYLGRIVLALLQALTTSAHAITESALGWARDRYAESLRRVFRAGVWVLAGTGALFAATLFLIGPRIPFAFVPQSDGGTLQVFVRMPPGTPTEVTNEVAGRLEGWLLGQTEVQTLQTTIGSIGAAGTAGTANFANMTAQLVPIGRRAGVFELVPSYRSALVGLVSDLPTARVSVSAGGGFHGLGSTVTFTLSTSDFNVLTEVNQNVIAHLRNNRYVVDVNSDLSNTTFENDFLPNADFLAGTGISPDLVADSLQIYTGGAQPSNVVVGGLSYPIRVQLNPIYLAGVQSLLTLPVYSSTLRSSLQMNQLGRFELRQAPLRYDRSNRRYSTDIDLNLWPGAPPPLAFETLVSAEMSAAGVLPRNVSFGAESRFGPAGLASELATQGPIAFLLALFLAYLVMGAQFNSWRYPVYLLLPVPLALVGALWFVWVSGSGLDVFGLLGMLMLIGLSAKNAILYLDFVVERLDHMPFQEALVESARLRFRPIVMTTLTVLVISFPLIFGRGQGAEFGQKMGIVMLGGILSSAILTFFVVPVAFYLFERKRHPDSAIASFDSGDPPARP